MGSTDNTSTYRARPITEDYRKTLQPEQRVVVTAKKLRDSKTILINGSIFTAMAVIQIVDILTGANVLEPILNVFTDNPETVANIVTIISQAYTGLNLYLRVITKQPITFNNETIE